MNEPSDECLAPPAYVQTSKSILKFISTTVEEVKELRLVVAVILRMQCVISTRHSRWDNFEKETKF